MSCCDETSACVPDTDVSRRSLLKGAALIASFIPAARPARGQAQDKQIKLRAELSTSRSLAGCTARHCDLELMKSNSSRDQFLS